MISEFSADGLQRHVFYRRQAIRAARLIPAMAGLFFSCLFIMGMGGSNLMEDIPQPVNNYAVTITDGSGLSLDLEKFSFAGKTFFSGKLGRAEASVDFAKVDTVIIKAMEGEETITARITMSDGTPIELLVSADTLCYGESSVARIRIELADIDKIKFHGRVNNDS